MQHSLRRKIGVIISDLPKFIWLSRPAWLFCNKSKPWKLIHDRNKKLIFDKKEKKGVICDWEWHSNLYMAEVFPFLAKMLMKRAFQDYPPDFSDKPLQQSENLDVSFVIGHKGIERLPHLLLTLKSIAAQRNVSTECIVVEQSAKAEIGQLLPGWVRYIYTPLPRPDLPYCRSWAFNVGARQAKGRLIVFHDNDFIIPRDYAYELMTKYKAGFEVIDLKRFIFYLTQQHTEKILNSDILDLNGFPEVVENLQAGGSLAVSKDVYFSLGGFDESFIGWGGEDNEFWDRAKTRKIYSYTYLPLIHLWHSEQVGKGQIKSGDYSQNVFDQRMQVSAKDRIRNLQGANFGNIDGPSGIDIR
jgi:hypothetical protein